MTLRLANASRSAAADGVVDRLDAGAAAGYIEVYTGSQPATPQDPASGTLLLTFTLNDPAFGAAVNGVADLDITPSISAVAAASGTAGWFRSYDSDDNPVFDGACGTVGQQLNLTTTTVSTGITVSITGGSYTQPM